MKAAALVAMYAAATVWLGASLVVPMILEWPRESFFICGVIGAIPWAVILLWKE